MAAGLPQPAAGGRGADRQGRKQRRGSGAPRRPKSTSGWRSSTARSRSPRPRPGGGGGGPGRLDPEGGRRGRARAPGSGRRDRAAARRCQGGAAPHGRGPDRGRGEGAALARRSRTKTGGGFSDESVEEPAGATHERLRAQLRAGVSRDCPGGLRRRALSGGGRRDPSSPGGGRAPESLLLRRRPCRWRPRSGRSRARAQGPAWTISDRGSSTSCSSTGRSSSIRDPVGDPRNNPTGRAASSRRRSRSRRRSDEQERARIEEALGALGQAPRAAEGRRGSRRSWAASWRGSAARSSTLRSARAVERFAQANARENAGA